MNQVAAGARDLGTAGEKGPPDHYWDALEVGDRLRTTGITVTESHLVAWAGITGDVVQFHLDAEHAASTQFGQRIAHGPFTLSVALGLLTQTGYFGNVAAWLGLDEVRARRPVLIGDTISARAVVRTSRPSRKGHQGIWTIDYIVLNQRDEEVMTFTSSFLVQRRPTENLEPTASEES
ncbi:MaoC family dehydratase [Occultella gossypii]|uniref:MaoC family dehydratase N-terminal domain-containing protein n=1 Tax=Occultella gossypii TaxID=2800820 RepID=A0ABS7S581_9MICO|nr:MaoC/PaaZ C-terminal domain-containing protein [Occultella gossypii]MBZ2195442.1 MaoC family dehydratase N-terminal domain-containing protein [Occultella gossypii]